MCDPGAFLCRQLLGWQGRGWQPAGGAGGAGVSAASLPCIAGMFLWGPSCHQPWDKPL